MIDIPAFASENWPEWYDLGLRLEISDGVHAPSRFSALLASTLGDCAGKTVIDAGSGAGLITVAALAAGAEHVIAIDNDPDAVRMTMNNIERILGRAACARVAARELDFSNLDDISADLLAVNPPQRPSQILESVEKDQRHLHEGGGTDGLSTIRLVVRYTIAPTVRTTAAGVLPIDTATVGLDQWNAPRRVAKQILPMHPSWAELTGPHNDVGVWDISRRSAK
jgi:methylase of polypeptide subunit release factors